MIRRIAHLCTLAAGAALFAAACGGSQSLPPIDSSTGNAVGDAMGQAAEQDSAGYDLASVSAPLYATTSTNPCVTRSGDWSDPDHDGVPVDGIVTFTNCSDVDPNGHGFVLTRTLNGTLEIKDPTPNVSDPGVFDESDALKFDRSVASTGGLVVYSSDDQETGSVTGSIPNPGIFQRKVDKSDARTVTQLGVAHAGTATRSWKLDYTPASAWTPGQPMVKGLVSIDGTFDIDMDSHSFNGTVTTPIALTVDPACHTRITAGELKTVETNGSETRTIVVKWTSCDNRTITVTIN